MEKKLLVVWVWMADDEWAGTHDMKEIASQYMEMFKDRMDETHGLAVQVYEHGGWWLMYDPELHIIGTANDQAILSDHAHKFWEKWDGAKWESVGSFRRNDDQIRQEVA